MNAVSKQLGISRSAIREWRDVGIVPAQPLCMCFRCEPDNPGRDEASYAALLGYYLGDGCISRLRSTYSLRVSCDRTYPGIIADVTRSIRGVRRGALVCHVRAPGVIVVQSCWNHWPCVFPQHGAGRKHDRALILEPWQRRLISQHPADFSEGSSIPTVAE